MALQSCPLGLLSGAEAGQLIRQGLNTIDTIRVDSSHCALWDFENVDNFIVSVLYYVTENNTVYSNVQIYICPY